MRNIKEFNKPFKKGDLIIYIIAIIIVVVCFVSVALLKQESYQGFEVLIDNELIMQFDFSSNSAKIADGKQQCIEKISDNKYKISSEYGFNIIEIDKVNKNVSVIETDCGFSKECMHMSLSGGGVIICAPHKFTVKVVNAVDDDLRIG